MNGHIPVLKNEVLEYLNPVLKSGGVFVDGTLGAGGHAKEILSHCSTVSLLGIDQDKEALKIARKNLRDFADRITLVHGNFADLGQIVERRDMPWHVSTPGDNIKAILLDLGVSSMQFDQFERGFSLRQDGPLDMRMDRSQILTAAEIINRWLPNQIDQILKEFGEEWQFRRITKGIVEARRKQKIETTGQLVQVIESALNIRYGGKGMKVHPATKTFQALRIAVNSELDVLREVLPVAINLLNSGGRIAVISFHSLEDRIVKNIFRDLTRNCICPLEQPECTCGNNNAKIRVLTKKPITPSEEEINLNPRSRSAKLRVAEKI